MRNIVIALALISAAAFWAVDCPVAMPAGTPGGLNPAIDRAQSIETVLYRCRLVQYCGPTSCEWRRVCPRGCPDGISCAPLYGAYGPWGGQAYWGSYSVPYYYPR